jgi:hypothetical protein
MRTWNLILLATLLAADARAETDPVAEPLAALGKAANCEDKASPWRPWCIAVDGWKNGKPDALPAGKVLLGLTIELENGKDVGAALNDHVSLSALAVSKEGRVKLTNVKPENKDEADATAEAVFNLATTFKGKTDVAKVPKVLADYLGGLQGKYTVAKGKQEWTWKGESAGRARKGGSTWIVIEQPDKANGFWLTILTDKWAAQ